MKSVSRMVSVLGFSAPLSLMFAGLWFEIVGYSFSVGGVAVKSISYFSGCDVWMCRSGFSEGSHSIVYVMVLLSGVVASVVPRLNPPRGILIMFLSVAVHEGIWHVMAFVHGYQLWIAAMPLTPDLWLFGVVLGVVVVMAWRAKFFVFTSKKVSDARVLPWLDFKWFVFFGFLFMLYMAVWYGIGFPFTVYGGKTVFYPLLWVNQVEVGSWILNQVWIVGAYLVALTGGRLYTFMGDWLNHEYRVTEA